MFMVEEVYTPVVLQKLIHELVNAAWWGNVSSAYALIAVVPDTHANVNIPHANARDMIGKVWYSVCPYRTMPHIPNTQLG